MELGQVILLLGGGGRGSRRIRAAVLGSTEVVVGKRLCWCSLLNGHGVRAAAVPRRALSTEGRLLVPVFVEWLAHCSCLIV
jgi:hypothetical protein